MFSEYFILNLLSVLFRLETIADTAGYRDTGYRNTGIQHTGIQNTGIRGYSIQG